MKKKPWHFNVLALFLMGCGLSVPVQVASLHQLHIFNDLMIILQQVDGLGWGFMALSFWTAYLMFYASSKLAYLLPILLIYTGIMNALSIDGASYLTLANVALVTSGFYAPFTLLLLRRPQTVLQDPEKKWWTHPERKRIHLPMMVAGPYNQSFSVSSYDISAGGAFLSFDDINASMNQISLIGKRSGLKVGDLLKIKIQSGRFSSIYCQGRVVRIMNEAKGGYPEGIGIQFINLRKRDLQRLTAIINELDRQTA